MIKPGTLVARPSPFLAILGGAVGMLLLNSLLHLAPVLGLPFVDLPRLIGGIFSANSEVAFWLGFWLFFLGGVFVLPPLFVWAWPSLPGPERGFIGALVKGVLWGLILWAVTGLLLPLFGLLNQLDDLANPGFFALGTGWLGTLSLLLGFVAYGVTMALIAEMGLGTEPIDTLGWLGHHQTRTQDIVVGRNGESESQGLMSPQSSRGS